MAEYTHNKDIHGGGDFGYALNSTSHIESIWGQLKSCLKNIHYVIPNQNIYLFVKEAEWRIKNRNKNIDAKIKVFFDDFNVISGMDFDDFYSD